METESFSILPKSVEVLPKSFIILPKSPKLLSNSFKVLPNPNESCKQTCGSANEMQTVQNKKVNIIHFFMILALNNFLTCRGRY